MLRKEFMVFLVLGVLVIGLSAFILADEDTNTSATPAENETGCVVLDGQCCLGDVCNSEASSCLVGYEHVFEGCDEDCEAVFTCELIQTNGTNSTPANNTYQNRNRNTIITQTKAQNGSTTSFSPYQKRNQSECLDGCKCRGGVVTCPTENGREMTIEAGRSGNVITITMERTEVNTTLELEQEEDEDQNGTRLRAKLSNGRNAEIKIMPDTASERALERLRLKVCSSENNCSLELKQVGEGDKAELKYQLQVERHSRILGLFRAKMQVRAEVNAENGDVNIDKPWWAFLAVEPEE